MGNYQSGITIENIEGYGKRQKDALRSLDSYLQYHCGVQLSRQDDLYYITTIDNKRHYVMYDERNGIWRCYFDVQ